MAIVVAAAAATGGAACSPDIFDLDLGLGTSAIRLDFGAAGGSGAAGGALPEVTCDPQVANACGDASLLDPATLPDGARVRTGCDSASARCFAEADLSVAIQVAVAEDDSSASDLARQGATLVRTIDVAYVVPTNTLSFDMPAIDLLVGPAGASAAGDTGVVPVGTVAAIPAGQTFTDQARHLTVPDGSPAHDLLEQSLNDRQPVTLIVTLSPHFDAGAPLPSGLLEINLSPRLTVGPS